MNRKNEHLAPRFNFDVLLELLTFLHSRNDLLAFMHTCKTLYKAGLPLLLGGPQPVFDYIEYLDWFCDFILMDPIYRIPRLRELHLDIGEIDSNWEHVVSSLITILTKANNLKKLSLLDCEEFLANDERFQAVFCSLPKLREFTIRKVDVRSMKMLEALTVPLSTLDIGFLEVEEQDEYDDHIFPDPAPYLESFADSLEVLRVKNWAFDMLGAVCPRVHTVQIDGYNHVDIDVLLHYFPNLRDLSVVCNEDKSTDDDAHAVRMSNKLEGRATWKSLRKLSGDVGSLYLLAAQCQVDHVAITKIDNENCHRVRAIIGSVRPQNVLLDTYEEALLNKSPAVNLSRCPGLTALCVRITHPRICLQ
ncbi:unnamed protein product [Somion occarium]|uniref:F-box domain-containing protein n=1 Tax=Somion occarium TaxID=3059160 RepID=A0ABP1E0A9_9APHY